MKVSIFGLGYVGAVSLGCLARDGHQVVGVDLDQTKLDLIRKGATPIIEEGMEELMRHAGSCGRVEVTNNASDGVHRSEVSFVCVGTPARSNGSQDLTAIQRLSEQVGEAMRTKTDYHVFVIRSTVFPGTVEDIIVPIIEKHAGKQCGKDFDVCFQPEFLREGSSIKDYDNPPFTVIGTASKRAEKVLHDLFGHLPCEFLVTSIRTAEMLKYACNIFHALKATFANEVGRLSQAMGVDSHAVMEMVCRDTRLNISPAYLRPGFAFGGSCLPKDLKAMLYVAKSKDVSVPMLGNVLTSNAIHIDHAINMVLESGKKSIGLIGLSFKSGTDDLRESPLVVMAERFIGKGLNLRIYDPEVNVARLIGANRRYIEETIPHISSLMIKNCEDLIAQSDVLIVGLSDKAIMETLYQNTSDEQMILDLVNIPQKNRIRGEYHGVCW
ncbi:MAG: nucleotide sugar dehydrogenase [Nitrospirales bacterium]|nr:UDP-glucose/GDP-mannose dehydrogenase family protein [Nitrospira sp.]MDR4501930.1 nucleotide sugar dehydrogenase [Nitrospirales bacterium]